MNTPSQAYLAYIQASLADASRLSPRFEKEDYAVEASAEALFEGQVPEHIAKQLFDQAKKRANGKIEDDRLWPIPVLLCPVAYALKSEHGHKSSRLPEKIAPAVIAAKLGQNGRLIDDDKVRGPVLVPRDLLEPTPSEVALGSIADADTAYAKLKEERGDWAALIKQADALLSSLTGQSLIELEIEGYARLDYGTLWLRDLPGATTGIQALVDQLRAPDAPTVPLYEALTEKTADRSLLSEAEQLAMSAKHLGQMECGYGLAASQREALMHYLVGKAPDVLAVDGPPGTGKTTLLLSAIATEWVSAALAGTEPPLIVATSTNNQAVLNILRAFAEVKEPDSPLAGRWLPDLLSYGLYLPAKSKKEIGENFPVHAMHGMGKESRYEAQAYESSDGLEVARQAFLEKALAAFPAYGLTDVAGIRTHLLQMLQIRADAIRSSIAALQFLTQHVENGALSSASLAAIQHALVTEAEQQQEALIQLAQHVDEASRLRRHWLHHSANEPWWMGLCAAIGIKGMRKRRDMAFLADMEGDHSALIGKRLRGVAEREDADHALHDLVDECEATRDRQGIALGRTKAQLADILKAESALRIVAPDCTDLTITNLQAALDIGPRFEAFKLATHYWEARYLEEVSRQLDSAGKMEDNKAPDKLLRQYRRLAKLFPCFVSTLFTLPRRFEGWSGETKPLYNAIDLLIVDEAGQVSPEVGAPSFALAKRALVVGDVDQIKPVWAIPRALDLANAERHGVIPALTDKSELLMSGLAASSCSLMQLAQRATPYAKHPRRGRGIFLDEHRRCWSEIIEICNKLAYQGLLKPCRKEGPRKLAPSLGYVHLPGISSRAGGSRRNITEATAIAKWLALRREEIEKAFNEDGKTFGELVAVITPFAAQARLIRRTLAETVGKDHGITVGTVHALQGAERRVVLFSPTYGLETEPGATFFDRDASILNVATSRAKDAFLVFGNMHLFHPVGDHPSAVVGRALFMGGQNEITGVPIDLLVPGFDMAPVGLIRDLTNHRNVLAEAFKTARTRIVIVSPFLAMAAIEADGVLALIAQAASRGVRVTIVTDPGLNLEKSAEFQRCSEAMTKAGATVRNARSQGVHSKLVLVDFAWLVVGSFNWLSAVRVEGGQYARYESSLRYDGPEAFEMIGKSLRDIKELMAI